jgi:outer membrane protein assembly factor BamB
VGDLVFTIPEKGPLLALNLENGHVVWEYDPPQRIWERAYTSNGELIFVGIEGGRLVALDVRSGEIRWEVELGINIQVPPVVTDSALYAATTFVGPGLDGDPNGRAILFSLNPEDGELLWEFVSESYILQTPFRYGEAVYAGGSHSDPTVDVDEGGPMRVYALDAENGALKWAYTAEDGFIKAIYASQNSVAYIAYQDFVNGLAAETGELIWRRDTGNWVPSLSGAGEVLYYGSANTVVHALAMDTGETQWEYNIPGASFNYLLGAPQRVLDDLYFLTQRGDIVALNAIDGTELWVMPTGITARVGLAASGPWLFIGDQDGVIYAYQSQ